MDKNKVIELLTDYNSYKYAVSCANPSGGGPLMPRSMTNNRLLPANAWDNARYTRIVNVITGAINEVLSDNECLVIKRKYFDRNKNSLSEIASDLNRDRGTITKWHTEALKKLCKALEPLDVEYTLISNIDHMWDREWKYEEPA
ncbi:hypothetical protein MKX33_00625 [Paenibacillus sp. FSL R5-0490]|uniref:hypothetical protein n=1 Tax=Paenibacillus sp. FSL R5-0490 TaxID=1920424 RepID=UPI0030CC86D2